MGRGPRHIRWTARIWLPAVFLGTWLALALFAPWLPLDPNEVDLTRVLGGPELAHSFHGWLGYDSVGRSVFDRLIVGGRTSLAVAMVVVAVSLAIGTVVGASSAYAGGGVDHSMMRVMDVFLAFPGILLAIALSGVLGPGVDNVVIALAAVSWVGFARLARAQTLSLRRQTYVTAAVAIGGTTRHVIRRHIIPNLSAPLTIESTFGVASVIIAEAGLSFLGLGVQPPNASWGSMILEGKPYILVAPHLVMVPGITIVLVVLSVNVLGDALRDYFDVRSR